MSAPSKLHMVTLPAGRAEPLRSHEDMGLTSFVLVVFAVPLVSALAGIGRWDQASLGVATLAVLLAGRELATRLVSACRTRRRP